MRHTTLTFSITTLLALAACGDSSSNPGTGTAAKVSQGTITARSASAITVNGTSFATSGATVVVDDNPSASDLLKVGMVVTVKVDDKGQAFEVHSKSDVRGLVTAKSGTTLQVGNQRVFIDDSTEFEDNASRQGGITANTSRVRVHGFPDDQGGLRASRIDRDDASSDFEIHGFASGLSSGGFTLKISKDATAFFTVSYASGVSAPAGLVEGSFVEVKSATQPSGTTIVASAVKLDDDNFGQVEAEIEGFVTSGTSDSFVIDGHTITTSATTKWLGGAPADLLPGVKVEAEGRLDASGTLAASKVSFRDGYRLQGPASGAPTAGTSGTFTLLGRTIQVTDATEYSDGLSLATIGTQNVEVRGYPARNGTDLVAIRVRLGRGGGGGGASTRIFVQAPVTASADPTLTIFGFTIDTSGASFQDRSGVANSMTRSAFFAAATPGTVVKARDVAQTTPTGSTFTADEVELEDDK